MLSIARWQHHAQRDAAGLAHQTTESPCDATDDICPRIPQAGGNPLSHMAKSLQHAAEAIRSILSRRSQRKYCDARSIPLSENVDAARQPVARQATQACTSRSQ